MIKNLWVDSNPLTMEDLANKQEPLGADFQKVIVEQPKTPQRVKANAGS